MYPWLDHYHIAKQTHRYYLFRLPESIWLYFSPQTLAKNPVIWHFQRSTPLGLKFSSKQNSRGSYWRNFIRTQTCYKWSSTGECPRFFSFLSMTWLTSSTLTNITMKLFAEDVQLYACSDYKHSLQRAIDKLIDWSDTWQLRCVVCVMFTDVLREGFDQTHQYLI